MKKKHLFVFLMILLIDQLTKFYVSSHMMLGQKIPIISGFFNFTYYHNTGAAWSMLEGKMWFFYIITIVALIAMWMFYQHAKESDVITRYGLVLMMAGTVGNFIDRLCFQYVRDFIDFIIFGYDFPVFNIADMALCIGVFFIIIDIFLEERGLVLKK
ncbi:MAG: signal peptidase II [Erysipelotrichaceae bacterium]|nr:signal peptidase II [Erysipelotrichaceae bacterium]